jgi:hypothetical protein
MTPHYNFLRIVVWAFLTVASLISLPMLVADPNERNGCSPTDGDWRFIRRDAQVTGFQPLPANIQQPAIKERIKLAGSEVPWVLSADLNNDGTQELVVPESTGLGAWTLEGQRIWFFPFPGNTFSQLPIRFVQALDLDGDGTVEIICHNTVSNSIVILDGRSGTLLSTLGVPRGRSIFYYNMHIGRYLRGVPGFQLALAANYGTGTAAGSKIETFLFSFDRGAKNPRLVWQKTVDESTDSNIHFVTIAASVAGDVDNDGQMELVSFIHNGLVIQDMASGKVKQFLPDIVGLGRNYGTFAITPLDRDNSNTLLIINDLLSQHLAALRFTNDSKAVLWKKDFGESWPLGSVFLHVPGVSPAADVNGDGTAEVVVSAWTAAEGWELRVLNAATGEVLGSKPGRYVLWMGDLTGDGVAEIIVAREETILPREFTSVEVWSFAGNTWKLLWEIEGARLESRVAGPLYVPVRYPPGVNGRSQDARQPFLFDWDRDGFPELFFRVEGGPAGGRSQQMIIVGYDGHKFRVKQSLAVPNDTRMAAVVGTRARRGAPVLVLAAPGGKVQTVKGNGDLLGQFQVQQTYVYKYLIADIDGDCKNELIFEDGSGVSAISLGPTGGEVHSDYSLRWHVPGNLLASADVDGRPGVEVFVAKPAPGGRIAVAAVKHDGTFLWETVIPTLVQSPLLAPAVRAAAVGRFTGRYGNDLYIVGRLTVPTGNGNSDRSWLLRGDTGEIVWYNDASDRRLPLPSIGPGQDAGAVPIDVNRDGADDIAMISQIWYLVLDGRTGKFLHTPVPAAHALQNGTGVPYEWTAYGALAFIGVQADGTPELLVHSSTGLWGALLLRPYGEFPVQGLWKETPKLGRRTYAVVANVDDRSDLEVVVADGTVRIYAAETGKLKYEFADITDAQFVSAVRMAETDRAEMVVSRGSSMSLLRIVDGKPTVVWTLPIGAIVGSPIIGDVDADGWSDIVVSTVDGELVVIGRPNARVRNRPSRH